MLVPLRIVTDYSLLKSTITIDKLVEFLKKNNITNASICDDNLYGAMAFYETMTRNGIKPIIAFSVQVADQEIYLYAKNYQGYLNLLKIHTLKEFDNLTIDNIKEYLVDIKIVLPYNSYALSINFSDCYLGYQCDEEKKEALKQSKNIVYVKTIRCLKKEDLIYLKYLEAIDKGVTLAEITGDNNDYFVLNVSQEDIESTINFIKDINIELQNKGNYIPKYCDESSSFLENIAFKGLNKRLNGKIIQNYTERLNYELEVIKNMGFVDYFLIVYDYVLYAKKNNILVGPGRGSAAGSLVSYCLGITDIDPLKYNLLFERFLNPERITMPDIDIDFEYTKRGQVIDYVREKYGQLNVAPIMTFGTLGAKQVIRDVGKVLNISSPLIDKFVKYIDSKLSLKNNLDNIKIKEFLNNYKELQKLYKDALKLEGLKRHISTHAAGVVISSVKLDNIIPIINNGDSILTGITMEYLEDLGLLKMDFLALRNLTIIKNVLDLIKESTGKILNLNKINLQDEVVFKLFKEGDTEGIFQYESSGMKNLMLKLAPSSFSDLVASVALFRPGPMDNIDLFIARKYGKVKTTYIDKDLEPILKETYGVIVYQEQVMETLVKIGGYTYAEADNIRRAMSKKKEDIILKDREHFVHNAIKRGYQKDKAVAIYNLILKFANYGFNKAHSVSYAFIGYQMAYLKVKFPIYFIANLLNMSIGSEIKTKEYINEAKKKEIKILKPSINISKNFYIINDMSLILPLSVIKNLGESAVKSIIEERTSNGLYKDYRDFVCRVYGKSVNKKTIISLINAGVLDEFSLSKKTMIENLDIVINYADLVLGLEEEYCLAPSIEEYPEYSDEEIRNKELESYGFYIINHPTSKYIDQNIVKLDDIEKYFDKHIKCVILIENIKKVKTKKEDNMAFITGSDETDVKEFVVFPKEFNSIINLKIGDIVVVNGKVTKRFDSFQINVEYLNKLRNGGV